MPLAAAVTVGAMGLLWLVSGSLATLVLIGNTAAAGRLQAASSACRSYFAKGS